MYQFFLHYIPSADPLELYSLPNNDTISTLVYALATAPESSRAWIVFKILQEDILRVNSGVDLSTIAFSSTVAFPPPPFLADISRTVVGFWEVLDSSEVIEWAKLARDIRIAHTQLVTAFGNGVLFEGKDWEEHRHYHARTLYWKWMGLQSVHGSTQTNESTSAFVSTYMVQRVSTLLPSTTRFNWRRLILCRHRSQIHRHTTNRLMVLPIRT
jgi:hypothetical protein